MKLKKTVHFIVIQLSYSHFHSIFLMKFSKEKTILVQNIEHSVSKKQKKHQFQLLTDKKNVTWFLKNEKKEIMCIKKVCFLL